VTADPSAVPVLDLWVDLVCPWCRLNHQRLRRARAELASDGILFDVVHRPFQLAPAQPAGVTRREHFTRVFGDLGRADAAFEQVRAVGAAEGVDFRFDLIELEPNTLDAHRLLRYAQQRDTGQAACAVAAAVYEAFFVHGRDIGDEDTLIAIGTEAGLEPGALAEHLRSGQGRHEVQLEADRARELGVRGVPTYGRDGRPARLTQDGLSLRAFLVALLARPSSAGSTRPA
jgi:predicted DsbA family dithiol-disulfide isomerase